MRQGLFEMSNVCLGLSKWGLIIFNVVFWSMGVVSFAIGLWLYISANEFAAISDGERLFGAAFLVSTGFGVLIVGFLGIVAALWESRIITTTFCILVGLALCMYLASGTWSLVIGSNLEEDVRDDLQSSISKYDAISNVMDILHERFKCCGADGVKDWEDFGNPLTPFPPRSCCLNQVNCTEVFTSGCVEELEHYEQRQLDIIGPIGIAFGAFQVVGILISFSFCYTLSNGSKKSYYT